MFWVSICFWPSIWKYVSSLLCISLPWSSERESEDWCLPSSALPKVPQIPKYGCFPVHLKISMDTSHVLCLSSHRKYIPTLLCYSGQNLVTSDVGNRRHISFVSFYLSFKTLSTPTHVWVPLLGLTSLFKGTETSKMGAKRYQSAHMLGLERPWSLSIPSGDVLFYHQNHNLWVEKAQWRNYVSFWSGAWLFLVFPLKLSCSNNMAVSSSDQNLEWRIYLLWVSNTQRRRYFLFLFEITWSM